MIKKTKEATEDNQNIINAKPTKDLFISMLIKDIGLIRAIIDLVDNSLDGAKRLRGSKLLTNLWIKLETSESKLRIVDNCGGIPVALARDYVFRFGRPEEMKFTKHSIGQFGVGMKRALFKIGNVFKVSSTHANSSFTMEVNVDEWKSDKDRWEFRFNEFQENQKNKGEDIGTEILITEVHDEVAAEFKQDRFVRQLVAELQEAHVEPLTKGLIITVNQIPLRVKPLGLLYSSSLLPAYRHDVYKVGPEKKDVTVKIYVGIGESKPNEAGWYIFCNGRLILGANQSHVTGWGEDLEVTTPKYHNQYARFRGYVFFDADDASLLPWNTTKTGVDSDSALYKAVRQNMLTMMKSVITFLNRLKEERETDLEKDPGLIEATINAATFHVIVNIKTANLPKTFKPHIPILPPSQKQKHGIITYTRPSEEIERVKKTLHVRSNKEVGEKTFEYFLRTEVLEDDK